MPKSSSLADGAKTYYRPIEAAIRWSGLLRFEQRILATLKQRPLPEATEFPRWPMLRLNAERIFDALAHGEMPYGKEGLVRDTQGLAMDDPSLTVRHVDLKAWMAHYYPGEKPTFLFDEIERALHPAISLDTVGALLVEREAIKARLAEHLGVLETLRAEHEALLKTHAACMAGAGARPGCDDEWRRAICRSRAVWLVAPRSTTARSRQQSAGADCCASSGASWRPWDSGLCRRQRSFRAGRCCG